MKKLSAIFLSFALLCTTGCNADLEGEDSTESGGKTANFVFTNSGNGGENIAKEKTEAGLYTVSRDSFTEDDLFYLFGGKPQKNERNGNVVYTLGNARGSFGKGFINYYTEDGNNFDSAVSALTDIANSADFVNSIYANVFPDSDDPGEKISDYLDESTELDFAARKEAENRVLAAFEKLGFSKENVLIKTQYSVKKSGYDRYKKIIRSIAESEDSLKSERTRADKAEKTESRGFYYFEITLKQEDIPFYSGKAFTRGDKPDDFAVHTDGWVIYSEKGIEYMYLLSCYKPGKPSGKTALIGFEEAKNLLAKKFAASFYENEVKVYDSDLVYLIFFENNDSENARTVDLTPAYLFKCSTERTTPGGEKYDAKFIVVYDAASGKEIATSWD